jgi:hypothetical protein
MCMIEVEHDRGAKPAGTSLAKGLSMTREASCEVRIEIGDDQARWTDASKQLDEAAAALFDGNFIAALRRARVAARQLRDTVGPEHPDYARLDALTRRRQVVAPPKK